MASGWLYSFHSPNVMTGEYNEIDAIDTYRFNYLYQFIHHLHLLLFKYISSYE